MRAVQMVGLLTAKIEITVGSFAGTSFATNSLCCVVEALAEIWVLVVELLFGEGGLCLVRV